LLHVAFLWHMHQPSYRDPVTGEVILPWVRLHTVKDYTDMATALAAVPEARTTVNWVPGLLDQCDALQSPDYGQRERFWRITERPAEDLAPGEISLIKQHFFSLGHATMLEPYPRYRELRDRVREGATLTAGELRDLQVWFNLAWTGVTLRERPDIQALLARGRDFSEGDKLTLLEAHRDAAHHLVPRWRALAASGQVELSTSPYYHPILPLLIDTELARTADPSSPLPESRLRARGDASIHIQRAVRAHTQRFGLAPRGMWPSEGSVTPAVLPLAREAGLEWLATDEAILWKSLGRPHHAPRLDKFVPWTHDGVKLVFRDHGLSDKLGFVYASWHPERAYRDFVNALLDIERATRHAGDHLVVIALDGENCWEHYPGGITRFLPGLLRAIAATPNLRLSTLSEALAAVPAHPLPALGTGSWIDGTFRTWLGDPVKNKAWELLTAARHAVGPSLDKVLAEEPGLADLVLRAEASDWWWWFGEGHSSTFDAEFDALFRAHLMAIWLALGKPVPDPLHRSVYELAAHRETRRVERPARKRPLSQLDIIVDGQRGWFFKWLGAGEARQTFGAIHRAETVVTRINYGNDDGALFLRLETREPAKAALIGSKIELNLGTTEPQVVRLWPPSPDITAACDSVFEARIPLALLGSPKLPSTLVGSLDLSDADGQPLERFPGTGDLELELLSRLDDALNLGV
jgi:alpha-amylase/alpha-mannosidase (GH57 family)